ncbi:MAG: UrcA family protein [Sphingomonas sp.]
MTITPVRTMIFATLGAAFAIANVAIAVPAQAAETAPTAIVRLAGLDLTNARDIARLDGRVRRAAQSVCGTADVRDLPHRAQVLACRATALDAVKPQIASLIGRAQNGPQLADAAMVTVAAR